MERRSLMRLGAAGVVWPMSGCLGNSGPAPPEKVIFENEYAAAVEIEVRVSHSGEQIFTKQVAVDPDSETTITPFEKGEEYTIEVEPESANITAEGWRTIHLKACGPNPTVYTVRSSGQITTTIAGCGA